MTADAVNMMLSGSGTSIAALAADQDASAKWLNYFIQVSSPTV
jgi:homoserine kinase